MNRNKNFVSFVIGLLLIPIIVGVLLSLLKVFTPVSIKFPSIFEIYRDFFKSFSDKDVILAFLSTAKRVILSSLCAVFIGVFLSFLLNWNKRIWNFALPTIDFLRSIPITFFIPAFAILLGVSSPNIIWILAVIPSVLIILINVSEGIRQQNQKRLHHFYIISGSRNKLRSFFNVTVFEVFPFFISGFKIALSYSIVVVTVLEYMQMGNDVGLGRMVYNEMEQLNYSRVYSIIILVGLIGYALNLVLNKINLKYE
ncbi:ABC transporter permease subunit [bacterium]|nr:ABC transporter permease subunit [bacterium]